MEKGRGEEDKTSWARPSGNFLARSLFDRGMKGKKGGDRKRWRD
jgi:hypothetical protein